jgi:transposase InsO family protein
MPAYGCSRMIRALRERGWKVNPKRVHRLMREDNPLCVRKRKFVITTDSNYTRKIYPNLPRRCQISSARDITSLRRREEFVFLTVILDAYSRRLIGLALSRHIEESFTLAALHTSIREALHAGI